MAVEWRKALSAVDGLPGQAAWRSEGGLGSLAMIKAFYYPFTPVHQNLSLESPRPLTKT
jgi:hypothetical protein